MLVNRSIANRRAPEFWSPFPPPPPVCFKIRFRQHFIREDLTLELLGPLKDLFNANACWHVLIYEYPFMWPKEYLNMCHIFYNNFFCYFSSACLETPTKKLPNQDSVSDIICQSLLNYWCNWQKTLECAFP